MFATTIHKTTLKKGMALVAVMAVGVALLKFPQAVEGGINRGLSICYTVIIPSLFPFLVLAGFITRSGIDAAVGRRLEKVTRLLFGLPGRCSAAILIGLVGGYPAGGAAVGELLRSGAITRSQARRLLLFCVNAGPAFIISTVGVGLLGDVRAGVLLMAAHLLASLLIGIAARFLCPSTQETSTSATVKTVSLPISSALTESVNGGCRSMLYMCGFVVLFTALQALWDVSGASGIWNAGLRLVCRVLGFSGEHIDCVFPILTEVTSGCVAASVAGEQRVWLLGMALGWGGLSVHCQLAATLQEFRVMGRSFWWGRGLHALLGGLLSWALFRLFPLAQPTAQSLSGLSFTVTNTSVPAAITLIFMCVLLLFTNSQTRLIRPKQ